ncbi:MAG: formylglycine-generating enzyme family protein [Verrucomicrobiales bacterium]|nr:formylglycine-generating enzyme family protein [Verrucomicrobiales bacterium]
MLGSLAWWLHEEENRTSATVGELGVEAGRTLVEVSASSGLGRDGEAFVRRMRDESGILAMSGSGRCGFLHLTFQEYLAGTHAAREGLAGTLAKRMGSSWWREVILVALAVGSRAFAKEFFDRILEGDVTKWDVTLIDQCLGEAAVVPSEPFVKVLKDPQISGDRKLAILRRLRTVEVSGLTEVCRELTAGKDRELAAVALELLQRSGGISFREAAARSPGPFESFVDAKTGIAYVTLPGGEFNMGSENGMDWEKPMHRVRLSPFAIGKYPVTNAEFGRFLAANPGHPPPQYWKDSQFNDPQQPVVGVSWSDAQDFCRWAGAQLPTEAQWEYACRAGSTGEYCFGDEESLLEEYAWFTDNSEERSHAVGEKIANAWGLHDMHGNVWEWCEDAWDDHTYGKQTDVAMDPRVTAEMVGNSDPVRVVRGGSWNFVAGGCRSAYRFGWKPGLRFDFQGFRVCLVRSPADAVVSGAAVDVIGKLRR